MNHLDLFSGIGGFALAVRWLGGQTIGFCEIEQYPQRVLAKNFPGVPIHDDIRTLTGAVVAGWGGCDLVTGGFPCQPFSVAGNRRGNEDNRALWHEMARVIDECRPSYVLAENVPGLISMALDDVLADLEALGYTARAVVIPAVAVDAPHRRDRLWIAAHADGGGRHPGIGHVQAGQSDVAGSRGTVADANGERRRQPTTGGYPEWSGPRNRREAVPHAARVLGGTVQRDEPDRVLPALSDCYGGRYRTSQSTVCPGGDAAFHGDWWPAEPGVGRMAYGVPRTLDRSGGLNAQQVDRSKTSSTSFPGSPTVREVRGNRSSAATSPGSQQALGNHVSLPNLSHDGGPTAGEVGFGKQATENVCDLPEGVQPLHAQSKQDVFSGVPVGTWQDQRSEAGLWLPEPGTPQTAHGVKNRVHRLKGLGNAIVPGVAYELLRVMIGADDD